MGKTIIVLLVALLAACAGGDEIGYQLPPGYLPDSFRLVARTDWSNPEILKVTVTNFAFSPNDITFHRDRATKLVLENLSDTDHTLVSEGFFQTIAVKQVVSSAGTVPGPWVERIVIPAHQSKEVWFIAARYGAWKFSCDRTGHSLMGMHGLVNVVK